MSDVGGRGTAAAGGWGNMWGNLGASASSMLVPWLLKIGGGDGKMLVFFTLAGAFVLAGILVLGMDATQKLLPDHPTNTPSPVGSASLPAEKLNPDVAPGSSN
jgi:nitrate/nitrite transporter NarK